ncbi:MAG: hypothetical protein DBX55_03880 [Verrucomicrobia bacterium]|nr:MAG: hypothetical protein DBX55_03880 [Verrucomicrobiota bacterium]
MNILFTSAGRRVELLKQAKATLCEYCGGGDVIAADANSNAPTARFCDKFFRVPKISDPEYLPRILQICRQTNADILIPTIDTELQLISDNADELRKFGTLVNISRPEVVRICRDKFSTHKFFEENAIPAPRVLDASAGAEGLPYPIFIKPADGSSSINAFKVEDADELRVFLRRVPNPILTEFIEGDEYTIDAFCDEDSAPVTIVPRLRMGVRSGEISRGRTVRDESLISAARALIAKLKPFGQITLQCRKNGGGIFFIEINPRFGGGAPMSMAAGANSILNLIRLKRGEKPAYDETWKDGVEFARFDDSVAFNLPRQ